MSELNLSDSETKGFPRRGDTDYLSPVETAFVQRILSHPESFPEAFWSAVIQKVALDGEPIPQSQIQGGLSGLWQDYDVEWTAASTQPAIGNGSLLGRYSRSRNTIFLTVKLLVGSTTTKGTGAWTFSAPPGNIPSIVGANGMGEAIDTSTSNIYMTGASVDETGLISPFNDSGFFSTSVPFTWATGDTLRVSALYDVAS